MNKSFMLQAFKEAEHGVRQNHGGPFGAIIVRNNVIVGWGHNRVTSLNDPTAHAEIQAIRDACQRLGTFDLSDCVLYTTCEPCPMCLAAALWAKIPQVYFSMNRYDADNLGFNDNIYYQLFNLDDYKEDRFFGSVRITLLLSDELMDISLELIDMYKNNKWKVHY